MKQLIIKLAIALWVIWWISLVTSCAPTSGKAYIQKEQKYYNYESAMKRAKKGGKH
jgi:hypothetical protein